MGQDEVESFLEAACLTVLLTLLLLWGIDLI